MRMLISVALVMATAAPEPTPLLMGTVLKLGQDAMADCKCAADEAACKKARKEARASLVKGIRISWRPEPARLQVEDGTARFVLEDRTIAIEHVERCGLDDCVEELAQRGLAIQQDGIEVAAAQDNLWAKPIDAKDASSLEVILEVVDVRTIVFNATEMARWKQQQIGALQSDIQQYLPYVRAKDESLRENATSMVESGREALACVQKTPTSGSFLTLKVRALSVASADEPR